VGFKFKFKFDLLKTLGSDGTVLIIERVKEEIPQSII
jgi:hypothetical protein